MGSPALRTERIEARLLPHQKERIEQAASMKGVSVSDFLVQTADEAAVKTIDEHERWVLSRRAQLAFFRTVTKPPRPNAKLRREMTEYLRAKHAKGVRG